MGVASDAGVGSTVGSLRDRRTVEGSGRFCGFDAVEDRGSVEWGADEFFRCPGIEAKMGGRGRTRAVIKTVVVGIGESVVVPADRVAAGAGAGSGVFVGGEGQAGKFAAGYDRGGIQ